ncbi:hypothetical protein DEU56DRAFT_915925 [Suillus clintonianus]|uniref:uncharacterized protein n=1 Tax=Suillus clintonianus TaxID=1904413 RepID=UPI001B86AA1F|nr:uncharacterized protein DEU56DRAFT_915925 [Suillus clintonianus]KAG2126808.1 hypothetical protein DEU56DRAFT_915925 [Suillus clintonianus]
MHQALLISEVLLEIFTHLKTWNPPEPFIGHKSLVRKYLAALARTCKAFYEPAMDLLWADFDSDEDLNPLFGCVTRLHPLIYDIDPTHDESTSPTRVEPLSADETRQFLRHSHRVRSLHVSPEPFLYLLSAIPMEACVFPRLQSLHWWADTDEYFDLFRSRTLRRLSLWTLTKDLQSIVARCDTLEDLSVGDYELYEPSLLSDSVSLCKRLVNLHCPLLDWAGWNHLSNIPTLLTVEDNIVPPWPSDQVFEDFSQFLNVTFLQFLLENVAYTIAIMELSQFPSLKEFEYIIEEMTAAEAAQLCRALSHCKAKQTLESINILTLESQEPLGTFRTMIPHLLCLTQLQYLRLRCEDSFVYIDNDLLLKAMSAWPHLRHLDLETSYLYPSVTFRGLFTALRRCPHLHFLRIAVDIVNIDIDPNAELTPHTSLEVLKLDTEPESPIPNAEALARLVFTWLPCVDQVGAMGDYREHWEHWDEVNGHLHDLRDQKDRTRE